VVALDADTDGTAIVYSAPFRLVLETREGRIVSDSVIAYGGFDFDGRRLAYLTAPKLIAVVPAAGDPATFVGA
jgi:hypothetical protein